MRIVIPSKRGALSATFGMAIFAPTLAVAGDWTSAQKLSQVVVDDSHITVIVPGIDNPASCSVPTFLRVGTGDANYQTLAAAILSVQAQGKTAKLYAAECYQDGSARITGVWIQNN